MEQAAAEELEALLERDPLDLRVATVHRHGVTLTDVVVRRRGPDVAGEATVDPAQLAGLAPADLDLRHDPDADGPGIVLRGTAKLFAVSVPVTVRVLAEDGAVVAVPEGVPIGRQVLFRDERLAVRLLSARPAPGGGLRVSADATFA
jgi:hypothetical protein